MAGRVKEAPPNVPADTRAEGVILGAIMLDNEAFEDAKGLSEADFWLSSNATIFRCMAEMLVSGDPVDIVTLSHRLRCRQEIELVGGVAYLASLTEGLPMKPAIGSYVAILQEKARLRRIMQVCDIAIGQCASESLTAAEIVKVMGEGLKGIRKR